MRCKKSGCVDYFWLIAAKNSLPVSPYIGSEPVLIFAITFFVLGCWSVIISGRLSGKAIEVESLLEDSGLTRILKYIFTHNPFTGYQKDFRILLFGVVGLALIVAGVVIAVYFVFVTSASTGR